MSNSNLFGLFLTQNSHIWSFRDSKTAQFWVKICIYEAKIVVKIGIHKNGRASIPFTSVFMGTFKNFFLLSTIYSL